MPSALALTAFLLSGCSTSSVDDMFPDQTLEYKASREASENLEIPPDLLSGSFDDALDVPAVAGGGATYSDYAGGRERRAAQRSSGAVLPEVANVELERSGSERWLEVQGSPQVVWPRLISFWREQGILLVEQDPRVGVMKTDWLENRAEIRQDFITKMMRKVAEGLHSTSTRDQYKVRIDAAARSGWTEVYLTHKGMEEHLVQEGIGGTERTVWEPSGSDPEKAAAMTRRLMLYLGASQSQANAALADSGSESHAPLAPPARLEEAGGAPVLVISDEYRRGWRMIGSALDRAGFTVDDRDRSRGMFYVRYQDTDAASSGDRSFMSRLAFWRDDGIDKVRQYRVRVEGGERETRVTVLDANGNLDSSPSAKKILTLLKEQMI